MSSAAFAYVFTSFSIVGFALWLLNWIFRRRIQYPSDHTLKPLTLRKPSKFIKDPSKPALPKFKFFQRNVSPVSSTASEEIQFLKALDPSMMDILDLNLISKRLDEHRATPGSGSRKGRHSDAEERLQESRERVLALWSMHSSRYSPGPKNEPSSEDDVLKKSFPVSSTELISAMSADEVAHKAAIKRKRESPTQDQVKRSRHSFADSIKKTFKTSTVESKYKPAKIAVADYVSKNYKPSKSIIDEPVKLSPKISKQGGARDSAKKSKLSKQEPQDFSPKRSKQSKLESETPAKKKSKSSTHDPGESAKKDAKSFKSKLEDSAKKLKLDSKDPAKKKSKSAPNEPEVSMKKGTKSSRSKVEDLAKKSKFGPEEAATKKSISSMYELKASSKKSKIDTQESAYKKSIISKADDSTKTSKASKTDLPESEKKKSDSKPKAKKSSTQKQKK